MWQVGKMIRFKYQENKLNIELYQTITLQFQKHELGDVGTLTDKKVQ